ncbi:MAG: DUF3015 family protein [Nitrospiraceae bacterium]
MRTKSSVVCAVSLVCGLSLNTTTSFAGVVVDIGGTTATDPSNIAGDYGANCPSPSTKKAITITPKAAGSNARVEAPSDSTMDHLKMSNVKITANCAVSNFRIAFGFNHAVQPAVVSPTEIRFKYYSSGYLQRSGTTPPPGGSVSTKASYANSPPSPPATTYKSSGAVGSEQTRATYVFSTSGLTSNLTNLTDPRGLQAEFTFTLPAENDNLQMVQYYVQDYPAAGGGEGGNSAGASFFSATLLHILMTTASTSQASGCEVCELADGSTPDAEKVKLFVKYNMDNLLQDIANGKGEHLASLATMVQISESQQTTFFSRAQDHYAAWGHREVVTPEQLLVTLEEAGLSPSESEAR